MRRLALVLGLLLCTTGTAAVDSDGDGIPDTTDNCPLHSNPEQLDVDADRIGNRCDVCVHVSDPEQLDADGDGAGDLCDVCPDTFADVPLPDGAYVFGIDAGGCAASDHCPCLARTSGLRWWGHGGYVRCVRRRSWLLERLQIIDRDERVALVDEARKSDCGRRLRQVSDRDGDGILEDGDESRIAGDRRCPDGVRVACDDNCPTVFNPGQNDRDADGRGDACDPSDDGDQVADTADNCPRVANPDQADADEDDVGDECDSCEDTPAGDEVDDDGCSEDQLAEASGASVAEQLAERFQIVDPVADRFDDHQHRHGE